MKDTKTCPLCKEEKELTEFYTNGKLRKRRCKMCENLTRRNRTSSTPANYLHHLCIQQRSKHRNSDYPYELTPEYLLDLWELQAGKCALSGVHMTYGKDGLGRKDLNVSVDRLQTAEGYVKGNVQLVCDRVNLMRHTLSVDMFKWWVKCINDASCD